MRYVLVVALILAAAAGGYVLATRVSAPPAPAATVAVARGSIDVALDITGPVQATQSRGLAFGTGGTVATVNVAEGDSVKADVILAKLDTTAVDSQLKAAQSSLTSAESALTTAQDARSAASPSPAPSAGPSGVPSIPPLPGRPTAAQLDANVDAAAAAVDAAHAAIDAAEALQKASVIRAPFDGTLTKLHIHVGDYVAAGPLPGLGFPLEVADPGTLEVLAAASEDDVVRLNDGQTGQVTFDALAGVKIPGRVCQISITPTLVEGVPTYPVQVCLDGRDDAVHLGLTATAHIVVAHRDNVLLVPSSAVRISGDDHIVNVVTAANVVVPTTVQIGEKNGSNTEILTGLNEGDRIETGE